MDNGPSPMDTAARTWYCTRVRPNEQSSFFTTTTLTLDDGNIGGNM
jgi:hypothetical protein